MNKNSFSFFNILFLYVMPIRFIIKYFLLPYVFVSGIQAFAAAQPVSADSSTIKIFETNITMDDGVALSTRIFLPDTGKSFAAVLQPLQQRTGDVDR